MISNTMMLVALAMGPSQNPAAWSTDYWQARSAAKAQNKPLAVVLATGANGQGKVLSADGSFSISATAVMSEHFVPVYVDVSQAAGRDLAQQFGIKSGVGVVISDRTGDYQAFNHDGTISEAELLRQLDRARTNQVRTSFYQPATPVNGSFSSIPSIRVRGC